MIGVRLKYFRKAAEQGLTRVPNNRLRCGKNPPRGCFIWLDSLLRSPPAFHLTRLSPDFRSAGAQPSECATLSQKYSPNLRNLRVSGQKVGDCRTKRFVHAYGHPAVTSQQQVATRNAPALTGDEILALSFDVGLSSRRATLLAQRDWKPSTKVISR
jgi:hypothetical protein